MSQGRMQPPQSQGKIAQAKHQQSYEGHKYFKDKNFDTTNGLSPFGYPYNELNEVQYG
jgi:hypothetical protein